MLIPRHPVIDLILDFKLFTALIKIYTKKS